MDAALGHDSELRFESPPIQQVVLSIFFKPLFALQVSQLIPIINQWSAHYPHLEEFSRISVWRSLTPEEANEVRSVGRMRTPLFVLQSAGGQRSLQFQQDRLELVWRFEAEGSCNEYVGYVALKREIEQRFSEFAESMQRSANLDVVPERSDATYQNLVDMPVRDFCVGVLTSWESSKASPENQTFYSGMRLSGFLQDDDEDGDALVSIDPGPDGGGTDFTIDVQRPVREDVSYLTALDEAHQVVLRIFTRLVSADLLESWGRQ